MSAGLKLIFMAPNSLVKDTASWKLIGTVLPLMDFLDYFIDFVIIATRLAEIKSMPSVSWRTSLHHSADFTLIQ